MGKPILTRSKGDLSMKSRLTKKVSAALAALLLVSIMMPVLAMAGAWFKVTFYTDGTVTGQVYSSMYQGETVTIAVYDKDGNFIKTVTTATYSPTVVDDVYYYYYDIPNNTVINATYDPIVLSMLNGAVTKTVYQEARQSSGGGIFIPPAGTTISASQITNAFANGQLEVSFTISGTSATLPASALANAPAGAVVTIENGTGSYSLPLDAIDFEKLAAELGVTLANLNAKVTIEALSGADATKYGDAVKAAGGKALGTAVNFTVTAEGNGKSQAIKDFGSTYVKRTIKNVNANSDATGVLYDPATGKFSFIPATFGNNVATLLSTTNSIYAVVEFDNSFPDVAGHWGKEYAVSMANKLISEGYEDGTFGPDRSITRAEFATLIVRALGLSSKSAMASFSDVKANDWFAKAVGVAAEAGIVKGYEDGTFQANKVITREELAAMVVRASAFAGTDVSVEASKIAAALAAFSDANGIVWANAEVAAAVDAGIVEGFEDGTFRATDTATRAQAAAMLQRFLIGAELISE